MATLLYRLGRYSFRSRRLIAGIWAGLFLLMGVGAATLSGETSDAFSIPGTESQKAMDLLAKEFPAAGAETGSATIVFVAPPGTTFADPISSAAVESVVTELSGAPEVAAVRSPFQTSTVSDDGRTAYSTVTFTVADGDVSQEAKDAVLTIAEGARVGGLQVEIGGEAMREAVSPFGVAEVIGLMIAALVLIITLGSLVTAGLPLLSALVGVGIGVLGIVTTSGFTELSSTTPILAMMLGLAVGIDYALFILTRYRSEVGKGRAPDEAVGRALGTAGSAVVFAGLTVVIALAGLTVVGVPFLSAMGLAAAGTVTVAVLVALTLTPAMIGFAQQRIKPTVGDHTDELEPASTGKRSLGVRWSRMVTRRPWAVVAAITVAVGVLSIPVLDLETGLGGAGTAPAESSERKAFDALAEGFGAGFNGPFVIVVDATGATDPTAAFSRAGAALRTIDGVAEVGPAVPNAAGTTAIISVVPTTGPSSAETKALVTTIRDRAPTLLADTGAQVYVTGSTAVNIDVTEKLSAAMLPYLLLIVGLALLLLMLVFRSILVPLKAAIGFLFTLGATFGILIAVFQWGWFADLFGINEGPILSLLPVLVIGILFGLAMDYQVFLVSRMREDYIHGKEPRMAVIGGFAHSSKVVVAAATIMAAVFAGFIFGDDATIKSLGFALTTGVLIDAFVIRMTLVPAALAILGKNAWWLPKWLDKALPNVDVEGEKLGKYLESKDSDVDDAVSVGQVRI